MSDTKHFDLHFEIGVTDTGAVYARTALGKVAIIGYRSEHRNLVNAVAELCLKMEADGAWPMLNRHPDLAIYPFDGTPLSANTKKANPNTSKLKPSELTNVPHPDCQLQCTAYDCFGNKRCKSICGHRSGL